MDKKYPIESKTKFRIYLLLLKAKMLANSTTAYKIILKLSFRNTVKKSITYGKPKKVINTAIKLPNKLPTAHKPMARLFRFFFLNFDPSTTVGKLFASPGTCKNTLGMVPVN